MIDKLKVLQDKFPNIEWKFNDSNNNFTYIGKLNIGYICIYKNIDKEFWHVDIHIDIGEINLMYWAIVYNTDDLYKKVNDGLKHLEKQFNDFSNTLKSKINLTI